MIDQKKAAFNEKQIKMQYELLNDDFLLALLPEKKTYDLLNINNIIQKMMEKTNATFREAIIAAVLYFKNGTVQDKQVSIFDHIKWLIYLVDIVFIMHYLVKTINKKTILLSKSMYNAVTVSQIKNMTTRFWIAFQPDASQVNIVRQSSVNNDTFKDFMKKLAGNEVNFDFKKIDETVKQYMKSPSYDDLVNNHKDFDNIISGFLIYLKKKDTTGLGVFDLSIKGAYSIEEFIKRSKASLSADLMFNSSYINYELCSLHNRPLTCMMINTEATPPNITVFKDTSKFTISPNGKLTEEELPVLLIYWIINYGYEATYNVVNKLSKKIDDKIKSSIENKIPKITNYIYREKTGNKNTPTKTNFYILLNPHSVINKNGSEDGLVKLVDSANTEIYKEKFIYYRNELSIGMYSQLLVE